MSLAVQTVWLKIFKPLGSKILNQSLSASEPDFKTVYLYFKLP